MDILFVSAEYPPLAGGVSTLSGSLVKAAQLAGHRCRVVTCVGMSGRRVEKGVEVSRVSPGLGKRYVKILPLFAGSLAALIRRRPDLLVCTRSSHEGIVGLALKRSLRVPYVLVAHGSEIGQHAGRAGAGALVRSVFKGAARVIANSRFTRDAVVRLGVPESDVVVIHPPLDVDGLDTGALTGNIDRKLGLEDKRVILTVGQTTARKGHAAVIQACSALKSRHPDLRYVIAGRPGDNQRSLEALARRLDMNGQVIFTGCVDQADLAALYARCEILVMPSHEIDGDVEGFGISFLEANLFGKPVIAGVGGGTGDAVIDGETGFLVDPADIQALTMRLAELLEDQGLRARLGSHGRTRVLQEFVVDRQVERVDRVLRDAVRAS